MDVHDRSRRLWSLDLARGLFIFTMIAAHSIFFFHYSINPLLQTLSGLGDFISFTGTLLIAGATASMAYLDPEINLKSHLYRGLKRLFIYLICYFALSLFAAFVISGWSNTLPWEIISLQKLVPFTEFILPFLILGFLNLPLRPIYRYLLNYPLIGLSLGSLSFFLGNVLASQTLTLPGNWQAIWVWHTGSFSFPILQYFPVYLLGMYLGKYLKNNANPKSSLSSIGGLFQSGFWLSLVIFFAGLSRGVSPISLFSRWPPSILFIVSSTTVCLLVILCLVRLHHLASFPWTRTLLLVLGQNAFALFFTHTAILYLYQFFSLPKVYSALLVIVLWLFSFILALILAKIIPLNYRFTLTLINWCECRLGLCVHAREPVWLIRSKKLLLWFHQLPTRLSFKLGSRRVQPVRLRNLVVTLGLFFLIATPVGIIENQALLRDLPLELEGTLNHHWQLIDDFESPLIYSLDLSAFPDHNQIQSVTVATGTGRSWPLHNDNNRWTGPIDFSGLEPGTYTLSASFTYGNTRYTTKTTPLYLTYPLFIAWTTDWEGYDVPDPNLDRLAGLAADFNLPLTHMFNPRIYSDSAFSSERADFLTAWVIKRRDNFGDEIGLHLHMFPDYVAAAGLIPKLEPVWGGGVSTGYDILTTAYSDKEMVKLLAYAKKLFDSHGLGVPVSFRAGAWFANLDTLNALQTEGFLIDTSGRTKYTFGTNHVAGFWDLSPTTRPYFPSLVNQNSSEPSPNFTLLEIPNNGADDYAFSEKEMYARFQANFTGVPLTAFQQITYLTHPQWLNEARAGANRQLFSQINRYRYQDDRGPVVFVTLKTIYDRWVKP